MLVHTCPGFRKFDVYIWLHETTWNVGEFSHLNSCHVITTSEILIESRVYIYILWETTGKLEQLTLNGIIKRAGNDHHVGRKFAKNGDCRFWPSSISRRQQDYVISMVVCVSIRKTILSNDPASHDRRCHLILSYYSEYLIPYTQKHR